MYPGGLSDSSPGARAFQPGRYWRWLAKPLAVGIVGGLVGGLVGAVMRDGKVAVRSLGVFAASLIGGFYHFVSHYVDHEWRVVYMHP